MTVTETTNTKSESRRGYWILVALSVVVIIISGYALAARISNYNGSEERSLFAYIQAQSTDFVFADRPITISEVTIESETDAGIESKDFIRVIFGDQELLLDVAMAPKQPLPSLYERHKNWMTLVFFADRSGMTLKEFSRRIETDEIRPRLAIAARYPFGIDAPKDPRFENLQQQENWATGEVRRDRWRFDFYEFNRDGSIATESLRFPESGKSLLRRQNYAKLKGEEIPTRDEGEIEEYSWQYGAAIKTMKRPPAITFEKQALRVAGWTLPTAAASFLVLVISFFFAIAPPRTTK
jgi:hypothetical protein